MDHRVAPWQPGPRRWAGSAGRVARLATVATSAAMLLSGCQQSGPASVTNGQYRLYATSTGESQLPDSTLVVEDSTVTLTQGGEVTEVATGEPGEEYTLCPPRGAAAPTPLAGPVAVGDLLLSNPAVFGDCAQAAPARVTVIDLASFEEGAGGLPFARWVEFCDTDDPDC